MALAGLCVLLAIVTTSCKNDAFKPNGYKSKVVKVVDSRTIELSNGLHVQLLGIKGSDQTMEYLKQHVVGKRVKLVRDKGSNTPKEEYDGVPKKIKAYVRLGNEVMSIQGKMLKEFGTSADLDMGNCKDSVEVFKEYVNKIPDPIPGPMTPEELLAYMKPATFQIITPDGTGTGFLINELGLALTNNHVLSPSNYGNAVCVFFGEDGTLDRLNHREVEQVYVTSSDSKIDFTIFQLKLRQGEKTPYMPLVKEKQAEGIAVWKLGCPVGEIANFSGGNLSNYNNVQDNAGNMYSYITHSCPVNNGDSGGPLVNKYGQVVGINQSIQLNKTLSLMTGSIQRAEGIAYAVDALIIRRILEEAQIKYEH